MKFVFGDSPHLGGWNEVVIGLIEHFTPKEGDEDINAYFTQGPPPMNEVSIQF
jgi:hypothetical protein